MNDLERKKTNVELLRVSAAKAEMEYLIAQKEEEIERLNVNIKIQETKEQELREKLK